MENHLNRDFFDLNTQSYRKRNNLRMQVRNKNIQNLLKNRRQNINAKKQRNRQNSVKEQIDQILANQFRPIRIMDLSKLLLQNQDIELDENNIQIMINCYKTVLSMQTIHQGSCIKYNPPSFQYQTPSKLIHKKSTNSSTGRSQSKPYNQITEVFTHHRFYQTFYFIMTNQTSKNSWAKISTNINYTLIQMCVEYLRDNIMQLNQELAVGSSHKSNKRAHSKNITLLCIIVMGNLCINYEHVRIILQKDMIDLIIKDLWPHLASNFPEDTSFLIANLLYHYPEQDLLPFYEQEQLLIDTSANKLLISQKVDQVLSKWRQLLNLYGFLCQNLLADMNKHYNQYNTNTTQNFMNRTPKIIKFKHQTMRQEYNRYYRHDLMDSIIKIRHLLSCYFKYFEQLPSHAQNQVLIINEYLVKEFKNHYRDLDIIIESKCYQVGIKLASKIERSRTILKQNNYKYLPGEEYSMINEQQYLQSISQTQDTVRFIRDLTRINVCSQIYHVPTAIKIGLDEFIHKFIKSSNSETSEQQQLKLNNYCWQFVNDLLASITQYLKSPTDNVKQNMKSVFDFFLNEIEWIQSCAINQRKQLSGDQQSKATSLYLKYYQRKFKIQLKYIQNSADKNMHSITQVLLFLKIELVAHYLPILRQKIKLWLEEHNHILILQALQSLRNIIRTFQSSDSIKQHKAQKRRSSALDEIIEEIGNCSRMENAQRLKLHNQLDFRVLLKQSYQKYSYVDKFRESQYGQEIIQVLLDLLNADNC